ncbi:hypothetical protein [Paenibacillus sp. MZ03-122A]|uniref:hypothetical protein n=1 Tax=Paenibacillus sp. MZ03-122A TaxID=2962033 RepID=UPI0020B88EBC|nr:hypothetical protein [Paenibacillus sp. MZ03-122A]MCP3779810.1 hypothetical protein [Paenibacillus sp. MZ03-122A]
MKPSLIKLRDIMGYLDRNGWDLDEEFPNPNVFVFSREIQNSEPITLLLPAKESFGDFQQRIYSALNTLSTIENRSSELIIKDINSYESDADKLEIRVISSFASEGSIPLSYASNLIKGLKNLIVSAAYTEEYPQRAFKRASQKAIGYSNFFKLGQTAHGSYIVTVESGSLINDDLEIIIEENTAITEPFSRRVMKRIHKSIHQIESFNDNENKLDDLVERGYNEGLNANICEALLSLYDEDEPVKLESKIRYSKTIENTEKLPDVITLDSSDYHIIKAIAEALREKKPEDVEIEGFISKLSSNSGTAYGTINISTMYDNKKHSVKVELIEDDYKSACDAHKNEKKVKITGVVDTTRKTWEVMNLKKFQVLG